MEHCPAYEEEFLTGTRIILPTCEFLNCCVENKEGRIRCA
jgi:hypothetical protein